MNFKSMPDFLMEDRDGWIHLSGHRIGLEDVIYYYRQGESPEMLHVRFPTVSLALFHKVIAYYLENQESDDVLVDERLNAAATARANAASLKPSLEEMRARRVG